MAVLAVNYTQSSNIAHLRLLVLSEDSLSVSTVSKVVLLQTAHSWANAGVLLGARMHRERVALLGVVHNCQHLCISSSRLVQRVLGGGEGGPRPAYYFLNVDQFVEHIIKINAIGR